MTVCAWQKFCCTTTVQICRPYYRRNKNAIRNSTVQLLAYGPASRPSPHRTRSARVSAERWPSHSVEKSRNVVVITVVRTTPLPQPRQDRACDINICMFWHVDGAARSICYFIVLRSSMIDFGVEVSSFLNLFSSFVDRSWNAESCETFVPRRPVVH